MNSPIQRAIFSESNLYAEKLFHEKIMNRKRVSSIYFSSGGVAPDCDFLSADRIVDPDPGILDRGPDFDLSYRSLGLDFDLDHCPDLGYIHFSFCMQVEND